MSTVALVTLLTFLGGLLLSVPIAIAIGLAAVVGIFVADFPIVVLAQRVIAGTQVFSLLAIPGFILAGDLMMKGGLSTRLVKVGQALVRHITGGLGMVTVISATFFAAISGSAPATTAAIGGIMIPEMEKRGWRRNFSTSLATASGPIGQMIPPSIPMIIWGVIAEESVAQLFLAGILPGLLIATGLMAWCWWVARREGIMTDERRSTGAELREAIGDGKWSLLAPVVILGGIYGGVFTPTEAAAVGVIYALLVGTLIHREISLKEFGPILVGSMRTTTIVCFIIAVASAFGWLIAIERIPELIANTIFAASANPVLILLMLNVALIFIGAVMDNIAAMVILGGVLTSLGAGIGLDPIHLGAIVVINLAVGMATPPFGYSLFVGSAISGIPIEKLVRPLLPMLLIMFAVLALVTYVPAFTLAIPSLVR